MANLEEWNYPTPEGQTTHEAVAEALGVIADAIESLEEKQLVEGVSIVMYGSSVTEFRQPSDIDVILIYDKLTPFWHSEEETRDHARMEEFCKEHGLSDLESLLLKRLFGQSFTTFSLDTPHERDIKKDRLSLDITVISKKVFLESKSQGIPQTEGSTQESVKRGKRMNEIEACMRMEDSYMHYSEAPYLDTETETVIVTFPILMEKLLGQPFDEYDTAFTQNLLGLPEGVTGEELLQEFIQWYASKIPDRTISEELANIEGKSKEDIKTLLKDVLDTNAEYLTPKEASTYRAGFRNYMQASNFMQGLNDRNAILIYGKNILTQGKKPLFMEDRDFIKRKP